MSIPFSKIKILFYCKSSLFPPRLGGWKYQLTGEEVLFFSPEGIEKAKRSTDSCLMTLLAIYVLELKRR